MLLLAVFIWALCIQNYQGVHAVISDCSDIQFRFYQGNSSSYIIIIPGQLSALKDRVSSETNIKFVIPGYIHNADTPWVKDMVDALLKKDKRNCIIVVDWRKYSSLPYSMAVENVPYIGKCICKLILDIISTFKVLLALIHLIGHSLGAHISGFTGKFVNKSGAGQLGRITGMDPAGPLFQYVSSSGRVCPYDADFVDIHHSDMGILGYNGVLGDADFFLNGGVAMQPGCFFSPNPLTCSHCRSFQFFIESINSFGFIAKECDSMDHYKKNLCDSNTEAIMGYNCNTTTRGNFFLSTNGSPPYARNGQK